MHINETIWRHNVQYHINYNMKNGHLDQASNCAFLCANIWDFWLFQVYPNNVVITIEKKTTHFRTLQLREAEYVTGMIHLHTHAQTAIYLVLTFDNLFLQQSVKCYYKSEKCVIRHSNTHLTMKVVFVGATRSGKTSIIRRLMYQTYQYRYKATVEDHFQLDATLPGRQNLHLHLHDHVIICIVIPFLMYM